MNNSLSRICYYQLGSAYNQGEENSLGRIGLSGAVRKLLPLLVVSIVPFLRAFATSESEDVRLQSTLVGTWLSPSNTTNLVKGEVTYRKDESFFGNISIASTNGIVQWEFGGKWKIEGKKLKLEYTRSTIPQIAPVGKITHDVIISLATNEFVFVDQYGKRQVRRRKQRRYFH